MKIRSLRETCQQRGISVPAFPFLKPDENLYRCLTLQPRGEVAVSETSIATPGLDTRLSEFLELAITEAAHLATCPEYCCPWSVIEASLKENRLPAQGSLWVLGAQSITPTELQELEARLDNARFVYDAPWSDGRTGTFLDPVCFIFRDATDNPVVVIQFKRAHMGTTPEPIEQSFMIHGDESYYVENDTVSVRLAVMLCSDSLIFSPHEVLPDFPVRSYLLLHLQLNPTPRQTAFAAYRGALFDCNTDHVEVMCLNWASGTRIAWPTSKTTVLGFPHSAIYWKSKGFRLQKPAFLKNHEGGAYYFYWSQRYSHVNVLHDDEHCLLFESTKPSQVLGPAATSVRSGLQVQASYVWDGDSWTTGAVSDGCDDVLIRARLRDSVPLNSLDRLELEQFVSLCCAEVNGADWHWPDKLGAFRFGVDESLRRVGFCRDPDSQLTAAQRLAKVAGLLNVFSGTTPPPEQYSILLSNCEVGFSAATFCFNIHKEGAPFATGSYVGDDGGEVVATQARDAIRSIFASSGRVPIFIWYRENSSLLCMSTADDTNIADGPQDGTAIV